MVEIVFKILWPSPIDQPVAFKTQEHDDAELNPGSANIPSKVW